MNKLFSVRSLENNVNYVQNSIFSLQSSGQVFVSLLPFILYYFTMQCIIRNFKITSATCFYNTQFCIRVKKTRHWNFIGV